MKIIFKRPQIGLKFLNLGILQIYYQKGDGQV
jgi:hypothetical protein